MRYEKMAITPVIAEQFLKRNVVNRKHVRQTWVESLAGEMKQGTFRTTHQGIAFNTNGELVDGQHRLYAIILSGCTVTMWVAFDCDAKTAMDWPVDTGPRRSVADRMNITANEAAFIDATLSLWKRGRGQFTTGEREATWNLLRSEWASFHEAWCTVTRKTVSQTAIKLPVFLRMLEHKDGSVIGQQYHAFVTMDFPKMWDSVQSLTKQLTILKRKEPTSDLMARVWIAFDESKKHLSKIQVNDAAIQGDEMRRILFNVGLNDALLAIKPAAASHDAA